jgi:2-hydroxychromene-2-carboxylate isomerase
MIEFFFDCSSPWTYLAFHNILPLAREFDEGIDWRPILVGGICNKINPSVYQARERPVPARTHYTKKDLAVGTRRGSQNYSALDISSQQRKGDAWMHHSAT